MKQPTIISIQVGPPQSYGFEGAADPMDRLWTTGFFKQPVSGVVVANRTGLEGDGQADLVNHGGTDKAILTYSAEHYPRWREELVKPDLPYGAFGENITVSDLTEREVCIGDQWRVGELLLELSQPRLACWKLARRWRIKDLALQVDRNGRSGWYFRVLETGRIKSGDVWQLQARPNPDWPVCRANQVWLHDKNNLTDLDALRALSSLALSWQEMIARHLTRRHHPEDYGRQIGPNAS